MALPDLVLGVCEADDGPDGRVEGLVREAAQARSAVRNAAS